MKKIFLVTASLIALAGCKDVFTTEIQAQNEFNLKDVSFVSKKGNATVTGNAFLRQGGGGVVTCAGSEVRLIPITKYSTERLAILYGAKGYAPIDVLQTLRITPEPPAEYEEYMLKTMCNSSGDFTFKNVPQGSYFVQTMVAWSVGYRSQGGGVLDVVDVKSNDKIEVIITK